MQKPDPDYRANPKRAIFVHGKIDQSLIDRLTPEIVALQSKSRDPITIYIDSPGGSTLHQEILSRLLSASDQDSSQSCKLITVVTGRAASAAADLLCSGSYAIAHHGSTILFHGVRSLSENPLTVARASAMVESMRLTNDRYALSLAHTSMNRFTFRCVAMRSKFDEYRQKPGKGAAGDLECFLDLISERISRSAQGLVERARERNKRYETLVDRATKAAMRSKRLLTRRTAEIEASAIRAIVQYELSANKGDDWTFTDGGLSQLNADFLLVNEYFKIYDSPLLQRLCDIFARFFMKDSEDGELQKITDEAERKKIRDEKLKETLRPLWLFFVALCYVLQEGENDLTAVDAFFLGLIDEVIGGPSDLFPVRLLFEYEPDLPKQPTSG